MKLSPQIIVVCNHSLEESRKPDCLGKQNPPPARCKAGETRESKRAWRDIVSARRVWIVLKNQVEAAMRRSNIFDSRPDKCASRLLKRS